MRITFPTMLLRSVLTTFLLLSAVHLLVGSILAGKETPNSLERKVSLTLDGGPHARTNVPVAFLIDAGQAQKAFVLFPDGELGRAQLAEPGLLRPASRTERRKELRFVVPEIKRGEKLKIVARLSDEPLEGRSYVWTGEPRQSRRLSCSQCHQGLSPPIFGQLKKEREMLEATGKAPPLKLAKTRPTISG